MVLHDMAAGGAYAQISGQSSLETAVIVTTDATTTARLDIRGKTHGTVYNETGSAEVITYYASATKEGTALPLKDEDGVAVTQTVGDDECLELPAAIAGVAYLLPVGDGGGTFAFHLER